MRSSRLLLAMTASLTVAIVFSDVTAAGAQKRGGTLRVAYGNEIAGRDFQHHAWLRNGLGRDEHRVRARRHHPRREVPPRGRRIVADLARRSPLLYWNTISGSPFYQVAQSWMKDYVYQAEFKVLYKKVWLDK